MVAATILLKNFVSHHTTSWSSTSTVWWYAGARAHAGALVHSVDFANTYSHSNPGHIMRINPVFDVRVHIYPSTFHSLDEGQREMLEAFGLIVNIV